MNKMKLEHGFTLLELLASIVIIVIVLTSFFSFFSQSAMFSKKNEENLVAMNMAREVLETVNSYSYDKENELGDSKCFPDRAVDELYPCLTYSEELTTSSDKIDNLFLVKIEIYKQTQEVEGDDLLLANAYGYVRE